MFRLDELRGLSVDAGDRIDQVHGVKLVAAVVALVTAGTVIPADRTGALDEAVGKCASRGRGDRTHLSLRDDIAVVVESREHLLHHQVVIGSGGASVEVVGEPQALQIGGDHPVVLVRALAGRQTLRVRLHLDRGAVFIRS